MALVKEPKMDHAGRWQDWNDSRLILADGCKCAVYVLDLYMVGP